jgi:hypothetical protein
VPDAHPGGLERADRPAVERDRGRERIVDVDLAPRSRAGEGPRDGGDGGDLADEEANQVDEVGSEVPGRPRARQRPLQAPGGGRVGIAQPILQVSHSDVPDLAELAGGDQIAGEPDGGDEPVVERAHVGDPGRLDTAPGVEGLVGVAPQRLLADHVLAGLRGRDRRLGVQVVGPAVVDQVDLRVGHQLPPIEHRPLEPETLSGGLRPRGITTADRQQPGRRRRWGHHVGDRAQRVSVGSAHEAGSDQPDADARHRGVIVVGRRGGHDVMLARF